MKLYHNAFYEPIELVENEHVVLIIENPTILFSVCNDLNNHMNEIDSKFVLSENFTEISLARNLEFIHDVISLDLNDKKIITKLIKDLVFISLNEEYHSKTRKLLSQIENHFMDISMSYNSSISINEPDLNALIKSLEPKIEYDSFSLLERIIEYMKLVNSLLKKRVFIFLNLKSFLSKEDLGELYKFVDYEKFIVLLIESKTDERNNFEKYIIIDNDMCIIK